MRTSRQIPALLLCTTLLIAPTAHAQSSQGLGSSALLNSSPNGSSALPAPGNTQTTPMTREVLFSEGFDDVPNPSKFTHEVPAGWNSQTTGVTSGEERWNGWSLATIRDWTWAAGTDMRHWFTQGHGQIAIIDSKQQRLNATDSMDARLSTPEIEVAGRNAVVVEFDSHYRHGQAPQGATVTVEFDGVEQEILRYDADRFTAHEAIEVAVPAGAKNLRVSFNYLGGNDDWWWAVDNIAVTEPFAALSGEPEAIIDVISDIQGDIPDFEAAIETLNGMPEQAGALVINGDIVDTGEQHLWDEFNAANARTPHASGKQVWTIGNHEMYGPEGSETYLNRFLEYSGQEQPWTELIVDGVPLITINTEYYSDVDRGGKEPFQRLSEEQLNWLDQRLAFWEAKKVPALVFTHPLLPQTVSMSHSAWYQNDFEDTAAISDVVSKYNHSIMFTSHTHASLHQNNWWGTYRYEGTGEAGRQGFPVVNTGAILNEYFPDGDHDETITPADTSTGLRVKVYGDRVRVEAWDFKSGEMIRFQDFARMA
ncbi:metallophosphoesterase family protein [Corynebacterium sp. A21]|uniref:metallophosphoesterase family protein n=1 Tax=Corynebacterium sp. A21 TaxID=3457318 RepID=UPI003FD19DC4